MMLLICGLWSAAGEAQGKTLAGHWEAEMSEEGRTFTFAFDFKQSGETLTGSVELTTQDRSVPIAAGRIAIPEVRVK